MKKILFTLILLLPFIVKADTLNIDVYYGKECPYCQKEAESLKVLKNQLGSNIKINKYEVWHNKKNNKKLTQVRKELNNTDEGVPYVVINKKDYTGYNEEIFNSIKNTIYKNLEKSKTLNIGLMDNVKINKKNTNKIFLVSGISDALSLSNLWILLFLSGILLCIYNNKKRLLLGSVFTFTSFLTYMILIYSSVSINTVFMRSLISVIGIIIGGIAIDSYMKINLPKKSFLQIIQEKCNNKMIYYLISMVALSIVVSLLLINKVDSIPKLLEIVTNITNINYNIKMILYGFSYLITSLITLLISNLIIKEIFMENSINPYNKLIAGIILLISSGIVLYLPSIFMMQ